MTDQAHMFIFLKTHWIDKEYTDSGKQGRAPPTDQELRIFQNT